MNDFGKSTFFLDLSGKKEEAEPLVRERSRVFSPKTDIFETAAGVHIVIELPGVDVGTLAVDVAGNRLTVQGSKRENKSGEGTIFLCMERHYGMFRKVFEFMGPVNMLDTKASYRDGILKLFVKKCEEKRGKGKKVAIEIEENW